jgi:acetyltransferase-like isoleucine patch superfamily enzyme
MFDYKKGIVGIKDADLGNNVTIIEPANVYDCTIKDNVFIGPFVEVQKGVIIGEGTRVQSHTFICELVSIGKNCFLGHGVMFTNDLFQSGGPAMGDVSKWKSTNIGNNVSIGSNSTILPVDICDHVVIGAGSVVTKNISKPGVYFGNPATFKRDL